MARRRTNFDHEVRFELPEELYEYREEAPRELDFGSLQLEPKEIAAYDGVEEGFRETFEESIRAERQLAYAREAGRAEARQRKRLHPSRSSTREPVRLRRVIMKQNLRAEDRGVRGVLRLEDWQRFRDAFGSACAYCGFPTDKECIEHVVPFCRSGENTIFNVVPACPSCNTGKGTKDPLRWLERRGFLAGFIVRMRAALQKAEGPPA